MWPAAVYAQVPRDTGAVKRDTSAFNRDSAGFAIDTTGRVVSAARVDTAVTDSARVARDTLKAPLARAEIPLIVGIGEQYRWNREELFATGALTLGELLDRVPGAVGFRSGWLGAPAHTAYIGDLSRVRVFYDGVEIVPLDTRTGGLLDLTEVQIWTLEELAVERGADELRIYARSWRVQRTTSNTRTDVATGDEDTNLYRGFFGRRFRRGEAIQLGAQQYGYGTRDITLGSGDQLAIFGRLGWAKGLWSVDANLVRGRRSRDPQRRLFSDTEIPRLNSNRTDAYLRAAYGDPERGIWLQAIAASLAFEEKTRGLGLDSADTTRSRAQYVGAAGFTRGAFRASLTNRTLVGEQTNRTVLEGRLGLQSRYAALSLRAERTPGDTGASVQEGSFRVSPLRWFALSGTVARRVSGRQDVPDVITGRAEAGLRVGRLWISGGGIARDTSTILPAPIVYDSAYGPAFDIDRPTGIFGTARGRLFKAVHIDAFLVNWSKPGAYRPQLHSRSDIYVKTNWLGKFPSGNFGFLGSVGYESRSRAIFPRTDGGVDVSSLYRAVNAQLEIRIVNATVFFRQTTQIQPVRPDLVPGFLLRRQNGIYGVRWQFWN
ncbi:MAG: hypothetical protein H0W30_04145 [Gemmatimonadaceae bacterium]|nr:hypothetical protein [Gemmatimonadaceae bacterium]